jgi:Ni/Fe-hydrogenase subunit HybB-like protein
MTAATVAVLALYAALIPAGEMTPPVSLPPGTATGRWAPDVSSFVQAGAYAPSWTEYGVGVGLLTVFVAVLLLAYGRDRRGVRG